MAQPGGPRLAASRGQQPQLEQFICCNYWQDNAGGFQGRLGLGPGSTKLSHSRTLRDTYSFLQRDAPSSHIPGFHAHLTRGTHLPLDTLRWTHACFMCKSNKRNMACGDGRHYSDIDKIGCMQKQGQVWLGAKAENSKSTLSRLPSTGAGADVLETRKTWSLEISWACDLIK